MQNSPARFTRRECVEQGDAPPLAPDAKKAAEAEVVKRRQEEAVRLARERQEAAVQLSREVAIRDVQGRDPPCSWLCPRDDRAG